MTNEYGSDQPHEHEQEEHAATPEATVHEGEPGVWTDDQPPHDDFGAANEDTATVSQEAATEAEQEESAGQAKSSRSMLPILAGLGGILLLGGVIYLQFGGHSSPPAPPLHLTQTQKPAQQDSASQLPSQAPPPADASPTNSAQANPNESDINALYKPAGTPTPVTMPSSSTPIESTLAPIPTPLPSMGSTPPPLPAANTGSVQDSSPKTAAAQVSPPLPAPTIAPQPGNPSNPVPPLPGQVFRTTPPSVNTPAPNTNVMANASANSGDAARLNALATRMDVLQKSLDNVTNMVAAVPAVANHNDAGVEGRLNKIEQTLTKIETEQAAKTSHASKQVVASSAVSESREESAPRVSHSTKSSTRHKHTHTHTRAASTATHHHASSIASSSAKSTGLSSEWVLRAATPKEAWVSSDPGSQDLRHVQIGESLPGIGVVHSIRQANGGWEIEGSTGIIR